MKCLVAVDGSKHSEEAARTLSCFPQDSEILLLHAINLTGLYPVLGADIPVLSPAPDEEDLRREGKDLLERVAGIVEGLGFRTRMRLETGFPASVILSVAEAENVDLILMGARGVGRVEELVFGSVSHQVLAHAPCPVLVVNHAIPRAGRVLVPAETGHDVHILLDFLARKPFREPPELEIVGALPTYRGLYDDAERAQLEHRKATEAVEEMARRAEGLGYRAKGEVVWGSPEEAILHEAERRQVNLIVIGSRGRSAWSRFLLGSAGHSILHRAKCPVLVVRERARVKDASRPAEETESQRGVPISAGA
jgi:nucleotide-binding universal stress UspA family protein